MPPRLRPPRRVAGPLVRIPSALGLDSRLRPPLLLPLPARPLEVLKGRGRVLDDAAEGRDLVPGLRGLAMGEVDDVSRLLPSESRDEAGRLVEGLAGRYRLFGPVKDAVEVPHEFLGLDRLLVLGPKR